MEIIANSLEKTGDDKVQITNTLSCSGKALVVEKESSWNGTDYHVFRPQNENLEYKGTFSKYAFTEFDKVGKELASFVEERTGKEVINERKYQY